LAGVLKTLHDDLDATVLAAYGWTDLSLPAETDVLLERLVALNTKRAAEEAAGTVRWLRPSFQRPAAGATQTAIDVEESEDGPTAAPVVIVVKRSWPVGLPEQIKGVAEVLEAAGKPLALGAIAEHFTARGRWRDRLPTILETLEALGRARRTEAGAWVDSRVR